MWMGGEGLLTTPFFELFFFPFVPFSLLSVNLFGMARWYLLVPGGEVGGT